MIELQTERFIPLMYHHKPVYVEEMVKLPLREWLIKQNKPFSDDALYKTLTGPGFEFLSLTYTDGKIYLLRPKGMAPYEHL